MLGMELAPVTVIDPAVFDGQKAEPAMLMQVVASHGVAVGVVLKV